MESKSEGERIFFGYWCIFEVWEVLVFSKELEYWGFEKFFSGLGGGEEFWNKGDFL